MRYFLFIAALFIGISSANHLLAQEDQQNTSGIEINSEDSVEYELLVFDAGFETYLATVPFAKDFYSNEYYRNWNIQYCTEWNIRHQNVVKYGDIYEVNIPYDQSVDYGIDFNYKLYYYFQYVEERYGIVLIHRKGK